MINFYRSTLLKGLLLQLLIISHLPLVVCGRVSTVDFLDGVFMSQMKEHNIAGVTFSAFSADTLDMTRSWGYSHVEVSRKVDENTGFMIGSVSKLFVWVAIMQLVEQEKIDLNKPVNHYLESFRLPETMEPVTMKHIMTHTTGFEDRFHLFTTQYEMLPELETYLAGNLPLQIFEPGTTPAYSNYAVALAGYVIEQISGMSFNDYVEQHIFLPLQMENTTFRQPATFNISEAKSRGYLFKEGRYVHPYEEFVLPAPAGAAVSTAADMLKFMKALLQCEENEGSVENGKILKNETIGQMLSLLYTVHPMADGMAYGFMRMQYHGKEIFWHGGDTYLFSTAFVLVPEMQTGIFFSINTGQTGFRYHNQFLLILDYLNGNKQELNINKRVNGMNHYAGKYKSSRRIESDYLKVFSSLMTVNVSGGTDGLLVDMGGEDSELYRPYKDDVFISDYKKLIFTRNEDGKIEELIFSYLPIMVYHKLSFRENATFNLLLLVLVLIIGIRNIIIPVWRFLKGDLRSREMYRWFLFFSGIAIWLFTILFLTTFNGVESVIFERPPALRLILMLPLVSLVFFVIAMLFWFQRGIWRRQPISSTFWQFAGFLVMVLFYLQVHFWNFFHFWV